MVKLTNILLSIITLLIIGLAKDLLAQDPFFNQPFSTAMYQNPALTGFADYTRVQVAQRAQWISIPGSFWTTYFGVDLNSKNNRWGFGLSSLYDRAGETLTTFSQDFNLAYSVKITEKAGLRFGLGMGYRIRSINYENLTFGDQIDPRYGFISTNPGSGTLSGSVIFINLTAGVFFHNRFLFAGYSAHNWNEPKQSFTSSGYRLPRRHSFHLGVNLYASNNSSFSIKPTALYIIQQDFENWVLGSIFQYKMLSVGFYSGINNRAIGSLGFTTNRFQIRYSYDMVSSRLTNRIFSAHEITLGFLLGKGKDNGVESKWLQPLF